MRLCLVLLVAPLILTAGCGDAVDSDRGATDSVTSSESPVVVVDSEVQLSCGGSPGFPASAMAGGVPDSSETEAIEEGLARLVEAAPMDAPEQLRDADGIQDDDWIILARGQVDGGDHLTVGVGSWGPDGPDARAMSIGLERDNGRWEATGWGDCNLAPVLERDSSFAEVSAPRDGLDRTSTSVEVGVTEQECTGARNPLPHLHEPFVVESQDTVTVYWTSTPPTGANTCPGNPMVSRDLQLEAPLGERRLLDGSSYPAREIGAG